MSYYLQSITMWDFTCYNIGRMRTQRQTKRDKGPAKRATQGPMKGQRQSHNKAPILGQSQCTIIIRFILFPQPAMPNLFYADSEYQN